MSNIGDQIVTVLTAIVGLAIIAVLVSRNAATSQVIGAGGQAFAGALATAVSPITGFTGGANMFNPGYGSGGFGQY